MGISRLNLFQVALCCATGACRSADQTLQAKGTWPDMAGYGYPPNKNPLDLLFFHILGIVIPTDFHIFQRGRYTTNQYTIDYTLLY